MLGYGLSTIAIILWASNFIIAVWVQNISAIELSFYRWSAAFVILLPWVIKLRYKLKLILDNFWVILIPAFLGITLFNTVVYIAANYTSSFNLSLISISAPIFVILINTFIFRDQYPKIIWLGFLITNIGIILLLCKGDLNLLVNFKFSKGDLLMFVSSISFAIYTVILERYKPKGFSQNEFLSSLITLGLLLLIPIYLWQISTYGINPIESKSFMAILYLGIFPSLFSFYSWNRSIALVGSTKTGAFYYFIPVFVFIFSIIFLNEKITSSAIISFVLVLLGLLIIHFSKLRPKNS